MQPPAAPPAGHSPGPQSPAQPQLPARLPLSGQQVGQRQNQAQNPAQNLAQHPAQSRPHFPPRPRAGGQQPPGAPLPSLRARLLPTGPLPVPDAATASPMAPPAPPLAGAPPDTRQQAGYAQQQAYSQPSLFTPHESDSQLEPAGEVIWSAVTATAPYPPVTTPSPGAVSVPEQRTVAAGALDDIDDIDDEDDDDDDLRNRRVRVVLAERKGVARPVRTVVDIHEGTGVGELLRSNLIGSQLTVALRFAVGAGITLGILPLLFALVPEIGKISILGLRLPWLVLGVLVYPFLLGMGWWHTRTAERVEQNFADHVQD